MTWERVQQCREIGGGEKKLVQTNPQQIVDDLEAFIDVLPDRIRKRLRTHDDVTSLVEVVMDLGRVPEARFPVGQVRLGEEEVTKDELDYVVNRVGHFGDDNRAGIERTLHRISVIRNRAGEPVGLTCRVGRAVFGSIKLIEDLVESGRSVLLLGRPGVGKTTMLRETARVLADDSDKRVVIVDTSNEIAGDGDVPHPAIGHARRMQVANTALQHQVMIEAVENHMPEVIVIDEMSTELEALAARTIAERGVQLVATAHGNTLSNVVLNPTLSDLVGGTQTVTLGDIEARRRRTQKTVLERKHDPTFDVVVEIRERNIVALHRDVGPAVDRMLRGLAVAVEVRTLQADGTVESVMEEWRSAEGDFQRAEFEVGSSSPTPERQRFTGVPSAPRRAVREVLDEPSDASQPRVKIHPFGVPRPMLEALIVELSVPVEVVEFADGADILVTTKSHYNRRPTAVRRAEKDGVPVHVLRRATNDQVVYFLQRFANGRRPPTVNRVEGNGHAEDSAAEVQTALREAEEAVGRVLSGEKKVELNPQEAYIRRLQHSLASRRNVGSASLGEDPSRRVVIRRRRR